MDGGNLCAGLQKSTARLEGAWDSGTIGPFPRRAQGGSDARSLRAMTEVAMDSRKSHVLPHHQSAALIAKDKLWYESKKIGIDRY